MKNSSLWIILQRMRTPFLVIVITYTISIVGLLIIPGVDNNGNTYHMSIFDAFYFITYTATTIGFGETPYAFTYPQRMWVSFSIYFNVLGWFYSIGSLLALLQDKLFIQELAKNRFKRQINNLKEKYILVLGYNLITSEIIKKAIDSGIRAVVIEKDQAKVHELLLENFTPPVPILNADAYNPQALEIAGINSIYCKAVVSLFQDDALNLRIALTAKLLNPKVRLAVKATTQSDTENLQDFGVDIIENPFEIIASQTKKALNAPHLLKLERWIYGSIKLSDSFMKFPTGKYVMCGFGRMGEVIYKVLKENDLEVKCIEKDISKLKYLTEDEKDDISFVESYDKKSLINVGVKDARYIIVGTKNDTTNLSIALTAKKINPNIITIVRENEMEDFSIFQTDKIDHILMPSRILIDKTINAIIRPSADLFVKNLDTLSEKDAQRIIKSLLEIDNDPILFELKVTKNESFELYKRLNEQLDIKLDLLRQSLKDKDHTNNVFVFMILRKSGEIMLPSWDEKLKKDDIVLIGCDQHAFEEIEFIANNFHEFEFAYFGKDHSVLKNIFSKEKP